MTLRDFSRSLPMLLLRSHQAVMAEFRPILRAHGITDTQWRVLRALTTADAVRIRASSSPWRSAACWNAARNPTTSALRASRSRRPAGR